MIAIAEKNLTIKEVLSWAEGYLADHDVPDAKIEAEYLLAHALERKRTELYLNYTTPLPHHTLQEFVHLIERRIKREPSQYIIGEQEFWGLGFKVTRDVLIPRPETELIVEEAVKTITECEMRNAELNPKSEIRNPKLILDLCAGSGCIAIPLAKEITNSRVYAVDISERALAVAKENAERHGVADRITFLRGDLFEPINGMNIKADIIVSNPPYISKKMMAGLEPEIKDYEPVTALYGGEDGLDFYRRIISAASAYLLQGGYLMLEMGYGQAEEIKKLIEQDKVFEHIVIKKDFAGIDRVIKAQKE